MTLKPMPIIFAASLFAAPAALAQAVSPAPSQTAPTPKEQALSQMILEQVNTEAQIRTQLASDTQQIQELKGQVASLQAELRSAKAAVHDAAKPVPDKAAEAKPAATQAIPPIIPHNERPHH